MFSVIKEWMNIHSTRSGLQVVAASALIAIFACTQPAHAYYWGGNYSPYTGASSWLWVARTLSYPLSRFSGSSTPYYLANTAVWNASYYASRGFGNGRHTYNGDYVQGDPYYGTQNAQRPFVGSAADQMVSARRANGYTNWGTPQNGATNGTEPGEGDLPEPQPVPPGLTGNPISAAPPPIAPQATAGPFTGPSMAPQPAPAPGLRRGFGKRNNRNRASNNGRGAASTGSGSSPLAKGFIDLVNSKYDGDIARALLDPQTRSYARAVGLIGSSDSFGADMSKERLQLIRQILSDDKEDAASRVTAVRMLLTH
jgi:hypothetical protein